MILLAVAYMSYRISLVSLKQLIKPIHLDQCVELVPLPIIVGAPFLNKMDIWYISPSVFRRVFKYDYLGFEISPFHKSAAGDKYGLGILNILIIFTFCPFVTFTGSWEILWEIYLTGLI